MVRKRLDERVRTLIERGVVRNERSILVLVGDHGKDQVPNLHQILTKTQLQQRPNVLWCYKKELGFSTHRKKRIKKLKRDKARGLLNSNGGNDGTADNFELFIGSTDINWCYYKDSHRVLGSTVGMLVLQDFEALTPNLMARTIETVKGGGLVVFLMRTVKSLKQLYTMTMDVHSRYRTESSGDLVPRFNERFILSLAKCSNCLVCDDELNVLPVSRKTLKGLDPASANNNARAIEKGDAGEVIQQETQEEMELRDLQESLLETPHVGVLVELAKTVDQAKALLVFLEACSEKTHITSTVAMTAARGRGKSAAMGLCLAGAISLGYSTMVVTAPEPENLVSVFDFLCRGLKALKYQEHLDYTIKYNTASGREAIKCIVAINIHRSHRQTIQYIPPHESDKFASAEIVAVDEAAAIPLPVVRKLMYQQKDNRLTFLSSTINGYEGTGRALSLKLIQELRESKGGRQAELNTANAAANQIVGARSKKGEAKIHERRYKAAAEASGDVLSGPLREIELGMPIRYSKGDGVESWLNKLLCLDSGSSASLKLHGGAPAPSDCELYSVNRDALFSYHKLSEAFLQKLMGLYTSAHYKNTPNDLQMLSDAPAHSAFVLLSPSAEQDGDSLPDILAVVQVALEGKISRKAVEAQLARGHRSAGDLIPWTIAQQFGDSKFAQLSGARIVRIAVHPSVQGMGYGSRAVELMYRFYNGDMVNLDNGDDNDDENEEEKSEAEDDASDSDNDDDDGSEKGQKGIRAEKLAPRKELPPLLLPLTEVEAPRLDWIGTSFGLTLNLHKFWSRAGMQMLYLRQTKNELTGEHSSIMIRALPKTSGVDDAWLDAFVNDSKRRFLSLLAGSFREMGIRTAISVLDRMWETKNVSERSGVASVGRISAEELGFLMTPHDMKRLEQYGRNLCDHHLITDLLPVVARMYFIGRMGKGFKLSGVQSAILCGIGVQNRVVDSITKELGLPSNQVLAMFNKAIRKISIALYNIVEDKEKESLLSGDKRKKALAAADGMKDVAQKTLEEDANDAAKDAIKEYNNGYSLPASVANDKSLMQYTIKGSDKDWDQLLDGKEVSETGMVSVRSVREKRKAVDAEDMEKEAQQEKKGSGGGSGKKTKKKRKSRGQ
jgi:N-acetyltransferase 10